ncbi:DEAD/DEAH box helicase [Allorhodopirellula solitaria]|uniref:ATP-dependent helicase HepA n=1 Tax=Allorhodopirellula solitaria TaxID=2527987 RepID=A0A5C5XVI0_9BACT|nr:DEAD/DEAH box helicase [Allorhodopirellula solitaria]TWT67336.1 ATP-dependent helicase HepA [Allorhodopirellula solitaria]
MTSRRSHPFSPPQISQREIEAMYSEMEIDDADQDLFGFADDDVVTRPERWANQFSLVYESAPDALVDAEAPFTYEVTEVYSQAEIHGTCHAGNDVFPVFARALASDPPVACGCPTSRGKYLCIHAVAFVEYLVDQLYEESSPLAKRVAAERFSRGEPNYNRFEPNFTEILFQQFDAAIQSIGDTSEQSLIQADTLERREVDLDTRLAWRVDVDPEWIDVYPISQQPKKRGKGYTKGRRIKFDSALHDKHLRRSAQDRRVLGHVSVNESYYSYRSEYELDLMKALETLIDAPNVYFDKDSVTVRRDDFEFEVALVDEVYIVIVLLAADDAERKQQTRDAAVAAYRASGGTSTADGAVQMATADNGAFLRFDAARCLISIISVAESEVPLVKQFLFFPGVAAEHGEELVKRLQSLQSRFTIRLPEELLGPIVDAPAHPVVLLRSNADGSLDVALRVRDSGGRILRPGSPPAISVAQEDGKPVQMRRDTAGEIEHAERLAETLGFRFCEPDESLQDERFAAHITDFSDALNLIDRLQSWSGDAETAGADSVDASEMPAPEVLWDRNSEKPVSVLGSISSQNVKVEINRKRDWFGISGQCEVGEHKLDLGTLLENLAGADADAIRGDFIRLKDGQWARIGEKLRRRLRQLRDATHADRKTMKLDATAAPAIRDFLDDGEIEFKAVKAWQKCVERLARAESLDPKLPEGLDAELRDYQVEGYRWLRRLAEWGVGGVLADDMGLGKTLQTLAVMLDRKNEGPALVIAPTSVAFNWVRETERFTPGLTVHLYRETERAEFLPQVGRGDVVVCSYGLALRDKDALADVEWGTMVLDEAQAIKNSRSKTSRAIADIPAAWTVALTGTPVENHLGELWSLFHIVSPGVFGGWEQFRKRFALPIEKNNDEAARQGLADRLKPFVLRRKKSEVLKDLPPRSEMNLYVDLSKEERAEYERVRLEAIGEVDQLEATVTTQDQRFRILALLTRLRQISCHPKLVNASYTGDAAKLVQLRETLSNLKEEGHRALIFSQFTQHLALIRSELEESGFSYEYLDGSTPAQARQERVDAFQNGSADVFLISLKAGGTGLNLTAADYVIHMDPWWNPAVEDQATDRAHRIGQDKPVMVYRIIARGTIEEEIFALHETKRDLVAGVMEGTAAAAKLDNDELIAMLRKG